MPNKEIIERKKLNNSPANTFEELYNFISNLEDKRSVTLNTTGKPGVKFITESRIKRNNGKPCLVSISQNKSKSAVYITAEDWGYKLSTIGVRITHYTIPLDNWFTDLKNKKSINQHL